MLALGVPWYYIALLGHPCPALPRSTFPMADDPQLPADHNDPRSEPKQRGIYYRWKPTWGWSAFGTKPEPTRRKPKRSKPTVDSVLRDFDLD